MGLISILNRQEKKSRPGFEPGVLAVRQECFLGDLLQGLLERLLAGLLSGILGAVDDELLDVLGLCLLHLNKSRTSIVMDVGQ